MGSMAHHIWQHHGSYGNGKSWKMHLSMRDLHGFTAHCAMIPLALWLVGWHRWMAPTFRPSRLPRPGEQHQLTILQLLPQGTHHAHHLATAFLFQFSTKQSWDINSIDDGRLWNIYWYNLIYYRHEDLCSIITLHDIVLIELFIYIYIHTYIQFTNISKMNLEFN